MSWIHQRLSGQRIHLGPLRNANRFARAEPEINLIAFIDVLLVVLIFLMVSTTFTRYNELAITLPTAIGSDTSAKPQSITITVSRDGRYALNGKLIDRSQLAASLSKIANPSAQTTLENSPQINIDADARAPHQAVMRALEAARDANLPNVVFSSQGSK
jgi:biopolymer transport protein ExbD